MKKALVLFTCNAWHSTNSMTMIGIFSSVNAAISFACNHAEKSEEGEIDDDDMHLLNHCHQTQGRSINYQIEEYDLN